MTPTQYYHYNMAQTVDAVAKELAQSIETSLTDQLNDLVKKGLLLVETSSPVTIQEPMTNEIKVKQSVRLVLKDQEYIAKLESDNKILTERLSSIASAIERPIKHGHDLIQSDVGTNNHSYTCHKCGYEVYQRDLDRLGMHLNDIHALRCLGK